MQKSLQKQKTDPITFALIRNALDSLVDEMAYTVIRTSRSEVVKDAMDFSTAFCDRYGRMMAQGKTIAMHLGAIPDAIETIFSVYKDDIYPEDVIVLNDPYMGGMHLPDIFMFKPVFFEEKLQGFAVSITHHTDVGGRVPGSNASDSTEIFQEGLRIPPIKLYSQGKENETLLDVIKQNVRVPDRVIGDLLAQYSACVVGEREFLKLVQRYGANQIVIYMSELLDYSEQLTRATIKKWKKGTFCFTDYIDGDGFQEEPIPISVSITIHDDSITVDYDGTSPQVKGAINSTFSFTKSCTYLSIRCLLDNMVPNNVGVFRAIDVKAPKSSLVYAISPAPCAARALTGFRILDTMFGALAQIVPNHVPAAGEGGNTVVSIGGYDNFNQPFIIVDMISGARGARPTKDGIEAISNPAQNLSNTPVEILEKELPLYIESYGFVKNSGGAGKYRGGLGLTRKYKLKDYHAILQLRSDRTLHAPYGLAGGKPGRLACNIFYSGNKHENLPGKATIDMRAGDVIQHDQAGGGGYGNPFDRDIDLVVEDVKNEKVSIDIASSSYGVVIEPETFVVNLQQTNKLRRDKK